jgi:hypothetical protein
MTKSATKIAVLYSLFAGLSTIVNIGSQMLSILIYNGAYAVEISILIGTLAEYRFRYFLEKRYIFLFSQKILNTMDSYSFSIVSWEYLQQLFFGERNMYFI